MSDPAKYRPDGELDEKKKSDPLVIAQTRLMEDFGMTKAELKAIQKEVDKVAKDSYTFAEQSPDPDPKTIYDFVYAD